MIENDKKVINKYSFNEGEAEEYIERIGIGIYDGGLSEKTAAVFAIRYILARRENKKKLSNKNKED